MKKCYLESGAFNISDVNLQVAPIADIVNILSSK